MMSGFIMDIKAYQTEYNRFPSEAISPTRSQTRGKIMVTLHPDQNAPQPPDGNPRKINFFDPPSAKKKMNGLYYDEKDEPVLVDPWGAPLYFMVSLDEKEKIPNPDARDKPANPFIKNSVIVYSAGPDKNPDTWEDNVMSWK